jgi:hypothetical protein
MRVCADKATGSQMSELDDMHDMEIVETRSQLFSTVKQAVQTRFIGSVDHYGVPSDDVIQSMHDSPLKHIVKHATQQYAITGVLKHWCTHCTALCACTEYPIEIWHMTACPRGEQSSVCTESTSTNDDVASSLSLSVTNIDGDDGCDIDSGQRCESANSRRCVSTRSRTPSMDGRQFATLYVDLTCKHATVVWAGLRY